MHSRAGNTSATIVTWEVHDPAGLKHIVQKDHISIFGTENLAHTENDVRRRPFIVAQLLRQMEESPAMGEWDGWSWLKL